MSGFLQTATAFLAIPLVNKFVKLVGKKELASAGILLAGVVYLDLYFLKGFNSHSHF